jgi:hypothetical protein
MPVRGFEAVQRLGDGIDRRLVPALRLLQVLKYSRLIRAFAALDLAMVCQSFRLSQFREGRVRSIRRGYACLIWTSRFGMIAPIAASVARRCMTVSHSPQSAVRSPVVPFPCMNSTMPSTGGRGSRHLKQ